MSRQRWLWLAIATIMSPITLHAGQIYGSISSGGRAVQNAAIEINCGGAVTPGGTVGDGSYRIRVTQQGQCTLTLPGFPGRPSAVVFSYPNPSQYDFELSAQRGGGYLLQRR